MTTEEEIELHDIEVALNDLIEAIIAAPVRRRRGGMTMAQALADEEGKTKVGVRAAELVEEPVGNACRAAIVTLGKRLFEIGGTKLMLDVLTRVSSEPGSESRRADILDKNWNGIGEEPDWWWS